jgi:hypothetical protein
MRMCVYVCLRVCASMCLSEKMRERERERVCVCLSLLRLYLRNGLGDTRGKEGVGVQKTRIWDTGGFHVNVKCTYAFVYMHKYLCVRFKRQQDRACVCIPELDGLVPEIQLHDLHWRKQTPSSCTETSPLPPSIRNKFPLDLA